VEDLQALVDRADHDRLLVAVDGLCAAREWDRLADLARRCRDAVELGRQLWGVAMHIDYRLALEGPPAYAAAVLRPGAGRFALGPLTEVAAGSHTWAELAPHLDDEVTAADVAQERVIRGEDLFGLDTGLTADLPMALQPWEPAYALPVYADRSAKFPQPVVGTRQLPAPRALTPAPELDPDAATAALLAVVEAWTTQSAGSAAVCAASGPAEAAVARLTPQAGLSEISAADGLGLLQWAGASGGAHGRRRGGAAGRFSAWWAAAALAGLDWPPDPGELGEALGELRWFRWAPSGADRGWILRLAVEDPIDGLSWAIDATDLFEDLLTDEG
jgi:hypothetical protein